MVDIEEKRRIVRGLLARAGRGLAEEFGFRVTNNPANLFQLLYLSVLLSGPGDYRGAIQAAQALRDRGWETARKMAESLREERLGALNDAGRPDADELANTFGDLAQMLLRRYRGDLRRLRTQARYDPGRERKLLTELPGVGNDAVDLFFREIQSLWPEVAPFADRRALTAARKLGLGRSVQDLAALAGGGGAEKLSWLAGALARTDLDNSYDEVRALARD